MRIQGFMSTVTNEILRHFNECAASVQAAGVQVKFIALDPVNPLAITSQPSLWAKLNGQVSHNVSVSPLRIRKSDPARNPQFNSVTRSMTAGIASVSTFRAPEEYLIDFGFFGPEVLSKMGQHILEGLIQTVFDQPVIRMESGEGSDMVKLKETLGQLEPSVVQAATALVSRVGLPLIYSLEAAVQVASGTPCSNDSVVTKRNIHLGHNQQQLR